MLESLLLRIRRHALRRGTTERSLQWLFIGVVAHLMHRALRDDEPVKKIRVRAGDQVTVSVREPAA